MKSRQQKLIDKALREVNRYTFQRHRFNFRAILLILIMVFIILGIIIALTLTSSKNSNNQVEAITVAEVHKAEPLYITPRYEHSQEFTVTYYCGCSKCCGKWSDGYEHTATGAAGTQLTPYYSIAVDPNIIPIGTICYDSEGNPYEAVDTGSKIKGNRIDMFTGNHQEAVNLGRTKLTLYW